MEAATRNKHEDAALYLLEEAGASWRARVEHGDHSVSQLELAAGRDCPRIVKSIVRRMRLDDVEVSEAMKTPAGCAEAAGSLSS